MNKKYYWYYKKKENNMLENEKINNILRQDDLGFLFWQLEEIENFYPCFKTMIKKENK